MPVHQANAHQQGHRLAQRELDRCDEVVGVDQNAALILVDGDVHGLEGAHVAIRRTRIDTGPAGDLAGRQSVRIALEQRLDLEDAGAPIPFFERAHFREFSLGRQPDRNKLGPTFIMGAAFALAYAIAPGTIRVVTGDLWPFASSISLTCFSIDPSRPSASRAPANKRAARTSGRRFSGSSSEPKRPRRI